MAKISVLQAENVIEDAMKNMLERISQIYADRETAKKKYYVSMSALEHANIVLSYTENKLLNGILTINDYIITKRNVLISESQASKAKYEYFFKSELLTHIAAF